MAAIMDEWAKIAHQVRRLGKSLGIDHPEELDRLQGDLFKRQSMRLNAVANFLQRVNERVEAQKAEAQAQFEAGNTFDEEGESVTIEELEGDLFTLDSAGNADIKPLQRKPKRPKKSSARSRQDASDDS